MKSSVLPCTGHVALTLMSCFPTFLSGMHDSGPAMAAATPTSGVRVATTGNVLGYLYCMRDKLPKDDMSVSTPVKRILLRREKPIIASFLIAQPQRSGRNVARTWLTTQLRSWTLCTRHLLGITCHWYVGMCVNCLSPAWAALMAWR